jgi:hypothetical protein
MTLSRIETFVGMAEMDNKGIIGVVVSIQTV